MKAQIYRGYYILFLRPPRDEPPALRAGVPVCVVLTAGCIGVLKGVGEIFANSLQRVHGCQQITLILPIVVYPTSYSIHTSLQYGYIVGCNHATALLC